MKKFYHDNSELYRYPIEFKRISLPFVENCQNRMCKVIVSLIDYYICFIDFIIYQQWYITQLLFLLPCEDTKRFWSFLHTPMVFFGKLVGPDQETLRSKSLQLLPINNTNSTAIWEDLGRTNPESRSTRESDQSADWFPSNDLEMWGPDSRSRNGGRKISLPIQGGRRPSSGSG